MTLFRLAALPLAVLGLAPATAGAAGFSEPRPVSPAGGTADNPLAVVAPTGRSALLWRRIVAGKRSFRIDYVARLGSSPGALGRTAVVPGGGYVMEADAVALADGTIVVCFGDETGRPRMAIRCSTAPPGRGFGPSITVRSYDARQRPALAGVVARPGGRVVVAFSRVVARNRVQYLWSSARAGRAFGASRVLGTVTQPYGGLSLGAAPDGTVAAAWTTPNTPALEDRAPVLRLLSPGASDFGAPVAFTPDTHVVDAVAITGGRYGMALQYEDNDERRARVVVRRPDGAFDPPVALPAPARGFVGGQVAFAPDGGVTALAEAFREAGTDCGEQTFGAVAAGPLAGPLTTLSASGQLASGLRGAFLGDGTLVAVWENVVDGSGRTRLQYAVRAPGRAFPAGRPLPAPAARSYTLAAGGEHAMLAWVTGALPDGPSRVVVSALRPRPPYARRAPLPADPRAPCS